MTAEENIKVKITKEASDAAYPAIWYAGKAGQIFEVKKNKRWNVYEVVSGDYKGKIITYEDCKHIIK